MQPTVPASDAAEDAVPDLALAIRELLVATDLGSGSGHALAHARALAEHFGARLTLYHVVQVKDHAYAHWDFAHVHDCWVRAEASARRALEHQVEGMAAPHRVLVERAASEDRALLDQIRALEPDLTVMATHGREGLAHVVLGSVAEAVFHKAFRPVLCLREPDGPAPFPYRRILLPTDFSPAARIAAPIAAFMARSFGASVIGLHVLPSEHAGSLVGAPRVVPSEAALWRFLHDDLGPVELTAQVQEGRVWSRIVDTARVEKADLIVMATRGSHSLSERILGSNTDRVVRRAPCPVLVA